MSRPVPLEAAGDDLDEIYAALADAERRRDAADAAADAAHEAGDIAALNRAEADLIRAEWEIARLEDRLWEVEDIEARSALRELRRDYLGAVL